MFYLSHLSPQILYQYAELLDRTNREKMEKLPNIYFTIYRDINNHNTYNDEIIQKILDHLAKFEWKDFKCWNFEHWEKFIEYICIYITKPPEWTKTMLNILLCLNFLGKTDYSGKIMFKYYNSLQTGNRRRGIHEE